MSETKIITSQYVEIKQTPASVGERIFARMIDLLIIFVYVYGLIYFILEVFDFRDDEAWLLVYFIFFTPAIFYSLIWEIFNSGRSPGKMVFKMRVVMKDGSVPSIGGYFLRWMLLLVDFWMSYVGIVVILLNKDNQRFGDISAGTMVIKENEYRRVNVTLDEYKHLSRNYRPVFPQAENLSLEQINTIHEALMRYDEHRMHRISALSEKVKTFLKIRPNVEDSVFLNTLVRDFQYYAMEEI
ncbi:MAG: RDD family protein [Tannerella sp.]|jgi:uncharacterized RDD family membrane protein YckC|nr:RDD family protein [Tannerella sp.]